MAELPPLAQIQQRQLVPYNNAGQVPIAGVNGGGELATLAQAVGQGATSIAQGFEPSTMAMRYQNAMNYAPMSNTERLLTIMPAADIIGGGFLAGAKVPRNALASNAVRREGAETLPEVEEIIAYHGSPHDFDKFQMDKIGTGEGAQAFGHGLYATDSEKISDFYKNMLKDEQIIHLDGKPLDSVYTEDNAENFYEYVAKKFPNATPNETDDLYNVLDNLGQGLRSIDDADAMVEFSLTPSQMRMYNKIRDDLYVPEVPEGKTYKVAIKSKLDNLLNYDTPLKDQPVAVQNAFKNIYKKHIVSDDPMISELLGQGKFTDEELKMIGLLPNSSGAQAYRTLGEKLQQPSQITAGMTTDAIRSNIKNEFKSGEVAMSKLLAEEGIGGMRYLDNSSRNTFGGRLLDIEESNGQFRARVKLDDGVRQTGMGGKGMVITKSPMFKTKEEAQKWADNAINNETKNYVIFDENLLEILAKYGIVGGVGLAAANEFSSPAQADSYPNYMPPQAPELDANPVQPRTMRPNEA